MNWKIFKKNLTNVKLIYKMINKKTDLSNFDKSVFLVNFVSVCYY